MTRPSRIVAATLLCLTLLPATARGDGKSVGIGAAIGAGVAAGGTALIASNYGENEGTKFCHGCFYQWGVLTIPAGAVIGATIGWGVGRARKPKKSVTFAPVVTKKARGLFVTARF